MKDWPTLVTLIATAVAPWIVDHGYLTVNQVGALGVLLGPVFTNIVHRLQRAP